MTAHVPDSTLNAQAPWWFAPGQALAVPPMAPGTMQVQQAAPVPVEPVSTTTVFPKIQAVFIMLGIVLAPACTLGAAVISQGDASSSPAAPIECTETWSKAIELQRVNPGITFPYSGPAEDQCHVSYVLEQVKSQPRDSRSSP